MGGGGYTTAGLDLVSLNNFLFNDIVHNFTVPFHTRDRGEIKQELIVKAVIVFLSAQ